MKKVAVVVKQELFDIIGIEIAQVHCAMNKDKDYRLCGSLSSDNVKLDDAYSLYLKANFCNDMGEILFVDKTYDVFNFDVIPYNSFSIHSSEITRSFNLEELDHVELFPAVQKDDEDW